MAKTISELAWNEISLQAKAFQLWRSWRKCRKAQRSPFGPDHANGYSALSSDAYGIAGTARAQLKNLWKARDIWGLIVKVVPWGLLGLLCYVLMQKASNQVLKRLGYSGMSADQCVVRQSILRKTRKYAKAEECIHHGLRKNPSRTSEGLLRCGLAEIYLRKDRKEQAYELADDAAMIAEQVRVTNPHQAARIYAGAADIFDELRRPDKSAKYRRQVKSLTALTGAKDTDLKHA